MEREIMFRAWDEDKKRFWFPMGVTPQQLMDGDFIDGYLKGEMSSVFIWSQFTGLLDKNGKEIFEGDIVEEILFYPTNERLYEVVFNQELFRFEMIKKYPSGCSTTWLHITERKSLEVVGNIYENPELLEVK